MTNNQRKEILKMSISSKLPSPLQQVNKKKPLEPSRPFSKLLSDKQKNLLKDKEQAKEKNPVWAPNLPIHSAAENPNLTHILSNKLSEITEIKMNTPVTQTLPLEIEELWQKLASTTVFMNSQDQKTTTFFLETNSVFSGMRITIQEFKTAPKIFNIELATISSEALSLIASHVQQLCGSFTYHEGAFGFSVHRIDTELLPYETHNRQKEEADEDSQ